MATPPDRGPHRCGALLAADQRYCLACGERIGPRPAALQRMLAEAVPATTPPPLRFPASASAGAVPPPSVSSSAPLRLIWRWPSPRASSALVLSLIACGVLVAAAVGSPVPMPARRGVHIVY